MLLPLTHRAIGLLLLLPLVGWAATGLVFFLKPGYGPAYASLPVATYPLERTVTVTPGDDWLEHRVVKSALGEHLLVKTDAGGLHLRLGDGSDWPRPEDATLRFLVEDAIARADAPYRDEAGATSEEARYGSVVEIVDGTFVTDTGVEITVDWDRLSFYQYGRDTRLIDRIYAIHYLRWTGIDAVDRVLGAAGIALVLALAVSGVVMIAVYRPKRG